jgi:nicotinamide-nucleotide amidase
MSELADRGAAIAERLKARTQTLAVAESSTGGLLSAVLLAVPGASAYFRGGGVIYTAQAREGLMGFGKADLAGIRSSSEPYARLLAERVRERLGATWGLGETGAAGPSGNRYGDAPGHTCIAVAGPRARVLTLETGRSDREANMWAFTDAALALLLACLDEAG